MQNKQPKNVGSDPVGYKYKIAQRDDAIQVLKIAKKQNKPVKILIKKKL